MQSPLDRAQGAKNKGNKYFKAGKYEQAITCYTEAIALCPTEKKADLSTFFQNRAAAYEQQVSVISTAISEGLTLAFTLSMFTCMQIIQGQSSE